VKGIKGLTRSTLPGSQEFIVNVKHEHDLLCSSGHRDQIFNTVKYIFWNVNNYNLPIYNIPDKLKAHHTTEKDRQKGIEKEPQ